MNPFIIKEAVEAVAKKTDIPSFSGQSFNFAKVRFNSEKGFSDLGKDIPDFSKNKPEISDKQDTSQQSELKNSKNDANGSIEQTSGETAQEGIAPRIPRSDGTWTGEPGNSTWQPDRDTIPTRDNPEKKPWGEILDENEIDGIDFKDGEPDFSDIAEDTVEIDDYTGDRNENFMQADEKLAEKWTQEQHDGKSWTPEEVEQYRKENRLTWHERSDMKTMDLVSRDVHGNVSHSGGIAAYNNTNNTNKEVA